MTYEQSANMGRPSGYTEEIAKAIRDWWRGYSDADVWSLANRIQPDFPAGVPGAIVPLTNGEWRALRAGRVIQFDGSRWTTRHD
jgi:hypothetical protein